MRILITGAGGQLGRDLQLALAGHELRPLSHADLDVTDARAANAPGARNVAAGCARVGAAMVCVSTNEVFDGAKGAPYLESDEPNPINAYGRSKLAGERLVQAVLPQHYIVRTAWLYGHSGNHFVAKILRAAEAGELIG